MEFNESVVFVTENNQKVNIPSNRSKKSSPQLLHYWTESELHAPEFPFKCKPIQFKSLNSSGAAVCNINLQICKINTRLLAFLFIAATL